MLGLENESEGKTPL